MLSGVKERRQARGVETQQAGAPDSNGMLAFRSVKPRAAPPPSAKAVSGARGIAFKAVCDTPQRPKPRAAASGGQEKRQRQEDRERSGSPELVDSAWTPPSHSGEASGSKTASKKV